MPDELRELVDAARALTMSENDQELQRRSFAYGNAHIENERVSKKMVDEAADKLGKHAR